MAYDAEIERSIDSCMQLFPQSIRNKIIKKKLFGGLAYLYSGKMTVGIVGEDLMVRIVAGKINKMMSQNFVRPMDFTNRPMKEFVFVSKEGFSTEARLHDWISLGLEHARTSLSEI